MSVSGAESGDEQQAVSMSEEDHAEEFEGQREDGDDEYDDAEEEEGEEGEGEEGEGEESDEESPTKKQRVMGNDVIQAQNQRLHGRVGVLNQEIEKLNTEKRLLEEANASLREKNAALQQDLDSCHTRISGLNTALAALASSPMQPMSSGAGPSTAIASPLKRKVLLGMVIRTPSGRPLHEITPPYRFPDTGSFPHAVDDNSRTHLKENQLEQRRKTNFVFSATFEDGTTASEYDIAPSGLVPYKLQFLYADNNEEVQTSDFTKAAVDALTHPKEDLIATRNMVNGELVFTINRFNVASTDTAPRHRAFVVKVSPTDPALADNPDLTVTSPPFIIRAKVTAPKAEAGTTVPSTAITVATGPTAQAVVEPQE